MLSTQMWPSTCQTTGRKPCSCISGGTRWGQPCLQGPADSTELPPRPHPGREDNSSLGRVCCLHIHCPIWGVPPCPAHTPAQRGSARTRAARAHLCTTRRDSRLSAGVDCWSAEKRFKVLVAGRPESDAGREKRGVSEFGTSPGAGTARGRVPAPRRLPESAGFAPDPPLLPLPQLSLPPGAKSWLLESIDPGCGQKEGHEGQLRAQHHGWGAGSGQDQPPSLCRALPRAHLGDLR